MKTLEDGKMEACPEDDSKTQSLSQVSCRYLKEGPLEYEARVLTSQPRSYVC